MYLFFMLASHQNALSHSHVCVKESPCASSRDADLHGLLSRDVEDSTAD